MNKEIVVGLERIQLRMERQDTTSVSGLRGIDPVEGALPGLGSISLREFQTWKPEGGTMVALEVKSMALARDSAVAPFEGFSAEPPKVFKSVIQLYRVAENLESRYSYSATLAKLLKEYAAKTDSVMFAISHHMEGPHTIEDKLLGQNHSVVLLNQPH